MRRSTHASSVRSAGLALAGVVIFLSSGNFVIQAAPDWKEIQPLLEAKCYECHGGKKTKGDVDLKVLAENPNVDQEHELWDGVLDSILNGDMPPEKAEPLEEKEEKAIVAWIEHAFDTMAATNPGDPGPVTMRRLTNGEYDRTIRDLTGHSYHLASEFQADGGGGEGFANTGDVLFFSSASLDKYFGAARKLADHATFLPGEGPIFHESRIGLRGAEQIKAQVEQGLYVWYQEKAAPHLPGDFDDLRIRDYLIACWKHRYLKTSLETLAKEEQLTLPFLQNWWNLLNSTEPKSRYLDLIRIPWRDLSGPDSAKALEIPAAVRDKILSIEADQLSWNNPRKPGSGVQRRQQDADGIRPYPMEGPVAGHREVILCFGDAGDGNKGDIALVKKIEVKTPKTSMDYFTWLNDRIAELDKGIATTPPPADVEAKKKELDSLKVTRSLFGKHPLEGRKIEPSVLAVTAPRAITLPLPEGASWARAETWLDLENPEIDAATMQWKMITGKLQRPLDRVLPGVLTIWKVRTSASARTMGEFHQMKLALPDMFERRLEEVARNLYRPLQGGFGVYYFNDDQLGAMLSQKEKDKLTAMKKDWRLVTQRQLNPQQAQEYDASMVDHLHRFAFQAWRRPLANEEKKALADFYQKRVTEGLDRESAGREGLVRILVSPHFLFKAETLPAEGTLASIKSGTPQEGDLALDSWEIASRLSYFLWATMPDEELRHLAAEDRLRDPAILISQAKRMLKDSRATALAEEFAGQWLKFSDFERHDGVNTKRFPEMTRELRDDMKRETVEFFSHLFLENRRVMDIVLGETTFLNERLAALYGVPNVKGPEFREVKVTDQHRGGLLGMGAILTKTSRPDRTSPILRGDFLYNVVLGYSSPPPPPNVPELKNVGEKPSSLRESMRLHSLERSCAVCHERIDPLGFSLESFDPIGRFRAADIAGDLIDDTGTLIDGSTFKGMTGLREQFRKEKAQFIRNFSKKLTGYALGRGILPTDNDLLDQIATALDQSDGRIFAVVSQIVTSRQFLHRRFDTPVLAATP